MNTVEKDNWKVYVHENKINKKKYIGITCRDVKRRWGNNGVNYKSQVFYNAIKKYGWDNFEHIVLFENLSEENAKLFEIELINKFNTKDFNYGYNISNGGLGGNNKSLVKIKMYDMNCNYIRSFNSATDACRYLNVSTERRTHIISCCNKKNKSSMGYRWSYECDDLDVNYIYNNARSSNNMQKIKIKVYDKSTNITTTYDSKTELFKNNSDFTKSGLYEYFKKTKNKNKLYKKRYFIEEIKE